MSRRLLAVFVFAVPVVFALGGCASNDVNRRGGSDEDVSDESRVWDREWRWEHRDVHPHWR